MEQAGAVRMCGVDERDESAYIVVVKAEGKRHLIDLDIDGRAGCC
jgi:hypothetical protein